MDAVKTLLAKAIEAIAKIGGGVPSSGFAYEPKMPKKLRK